MGVKLFVWTFPFHWIVNLENCNFLEAGFSFRLQIKRKEERKISVAFWLR
jgi:hypothetical protein